MTDVQETVKWEVCGPFGEHEDTWSIEEMLPNGRIMAETYEKDRADEIVTAHNALSEALAENTRLQRIVSDCAAEYEMWGSAEEKGKQLSEALAALREMLAGGYYMDCTCGHCAEISRKAQDLIAKLSQATAPTEGGKLNA